MAKSILNDSIQGQLFELNEKLDKLLSKEQNNETVIQNQPATENETQQPVLYGKDIDEITYKHNRILFSAILKRLNRIEYRKLDIISRKLNPIRKRPQVKIKGRKFYLSSLAIAFLTVTGVISVCANFKQCSNYERLNDKYYHQLITIDKLKTENDSLKVKVVEKPTTTKKRK